MITKVSRFWSVCLTLVVFFNLAKTRAQVNFSVGTMKPGQEIVITYEVTLNSSLLPAVTQISHQASVSGSGFTSPRSTDDPETTAADDATVTLLQNDVPVITAGNTVAYTENDSAVVVSPGLTATDSDSANLSGATVSITANFTSGDTLGFADQNGISGSYASGTGILTLTGSASVANYQAALRTITFSSSSENPGTSSRTISFVANDGIADSAAAASTVNVSEVNDLPLLTAGNTISYTENGAGTAISSALTVTDPDAANLSGASVSISAGFLSGDTLGFANQNGITGVYNSGTGVLTLSGTTTIGNYQTALRSVTYSSSSEDPAAGGANPSRTISFTVDDGVATSVAASTTINVTSINDDPVGGVDTIQRGPNDDVKVKLAALLANDTDPDGGILSITGVTSPTAGGATVSVSGGWVLYTHSGTTVDSFTYTLSDGQGGSSLVTVNVTLQGQDAQAGPALTASIDAGGAHISFFGIPGLTYTIQSASSALGPWTDAGGASENASGHYTFTDPSVSPPAFYRVVYRP